MTDKTKVTRQNAITFLECAARNWRHLPCLTAADIEDVRVELERQRQSATAPLEAQIARLEIDAERYRYLRNRDVWPDGEQPKAGLFIGMVPENLILTEEDADHAIDQYIAANKGQPNA